MADNNPYGTDLQYFDMDGIPVRMLDPNSVPEKMRPDGTWEPFYDTYRFSFATPMSKEDFQQLVREFSSSGGEESVDGYIDSGEESNSVQPEHERPIPKALGESSGSAGGYIIPTGATKDDESRR